MSQWNDFSANFFGGKYLSNNCCVRDAQLGHILQPDTALHCAWK